MVAEVLEIGCCVYTDSKLCLVLLLRGSRQVSTKEKFLALHLAHQGLAWAWRDCCGSPGVLPAAVSFAAYDHKRKFNSPWPCASRSCLKKPPPLLSQGTCCPPESWHKYFHNHSLIQHKDLIQLKKIGLDVGVFCCCWLLKQKTKQKKKVRFLLFSHAEPCRCQC